jgi:hypothetical protein
LTWTVQEEAAPPAGGAAVGELLGHSTFVVHGHAVFRFVEPVILVIDDCKSCDLWVIGEPFQHFFAARTFKFIRAASGIADNAQQARQVVTA